MIESKPMSFQDKLDLVQSSCKVADFWGLKPTELLVWVAAICKKDKAKEWNEIAEEIEAFNEASFEERAKMLGVELIKK